MFVPEMSGLSLEEINLLFQSRIPARKSIAWNREVRARDHGFNNDVSNVNAVDPKREISQHEKDSIKPVAQHVDSTDSTSTAV
jgi:hypothetical protein